MGTGQPEVVVVGAGLAGLAAAESLALGGARVRILEAEDVVGGRFATPDRVTLQTGGRSWEFPVEHGIHGVWRRYANLRALLDRHGLLERYPTCPRQELVVLGDDDRRPLYIEVGARVRDSRLPAPFCYAELLRERDLLPLVLRSHPLETLLATLDLSHAFAFDPMTDGPRYGQHTVADFLGTWPRWQRELFSALAHSAFFTEIDEAGLGAFLAGLQLYVIRDPLDVGFGLGQLSTDQVLAPLVRGVEQAGGELLTGCRAQSIERDGDQLVIRALRGRRKRVFRPQALVLALDPSGYEQLQGLDEVIPPVEVPDTVASASVRFWFDGAPAAERASAGMFAGPDFDNYFWLHRIQDEYVDFHRQTGGSAVEVHLYGNKARRAQDEDDATLLARVGARVERAWPGVAGRRIHGHVRRNAKTHVSLGPGVYFRLPPVATGAPDIVRAGDWIASGRPDFYLERATTTGLQAALQLAGQLALRQSEMPRVEPEHAPSAGFARYARLIRGLRDRGLPLGRFRVSPRGKQTE